MPADAGIYQQFLQPPKSVVDYQTQYDQADARKNALAQSVLALQKGQMDLSNAADVNRQKVGMRTDLASGKYDLSNPAHLAELAARYPDTAPAYLETVQKSATARAAATKDTAQAGEADAKTAASKLDQSIKAHDFHVQQLGAVNDPQTAQQWAIAGLQSGVFTPEQFQAGYARIPTDPAGFAQWKQAAMQGGVTATEQLKMKQAQLIADNSNATSRANNKDTNATHIQTTGMTNATSIRTTGMNNATSTANNRANIAKDFTIAGVKPDGTPMDGGGLLSPESVINAATRYNMDGTLPPNLGRGTQGPRQTAQILNEAARQAAAKGDSPEAQRIAQLANKANAAAMGTIEKQATMVGAFEKNFSKNADIALELSQKVDRTGVPIVNSWINAGRRAVTGNPDLAAFDANIKATVNEYAKIVGGGSGSGATAQGEISKIEGLLSTAQTPQQVASVISLMKRETANRLQAFEEQKAELRNSMIRPGSAKPAPALAAPAAATTAVPPDIANILKKHGGK